MAFLDFLFGKRAKTQQYPRFEPGQIGTINQLLSGARPGQQQAMDYLMDLLSGESEAFQDFQRPALRQFEEELLPGIAERFTGMFGEGSNRSSAFGQQLGKAAAGLSENLAAQRAGLQGGAAQQLMGNLANILAYQQQPRFETTYRQGSPGLLQPLVQGAGQAVAALPFLL